LVLNLIRNSNINFYSGCTNIIFSDYELDVNLFDAYQNNNLSNLTQFYNCNWIGNAFNQPLSNSLDNLINLTHLTFGTNFNQPLSNSLDKLINLTHLTFGDAFNSQLSNSLDKLTLLIHLTFDYNFNQP